MMDSSVIKEAKDVSSKKTYAYVGVIGIVALLTVGLFSFSSVGSKFTPEAFSSEESLTISVSNEYTEKYGVPGLDYPWVQKQGATIVEPYTETKLKVAGANVGEKSNVKYVWKVTGQTLSGQSVIIKFLGVDYYDIQVDEVNTKTLEVLRSTSMTVTCRYVRREIRDLTDSDRVTFLEAIETMYNVALEDGLEMYGPKYKDMNFFAILHNNNAGDPYCDHMHDGYGFLTTHNALSLQFEQSLQSINPKISLPYWDYTIDGEVADGDSDVWRESIIFDDSWFGESSPTGAVQTRGRFAYIPVISNQYNSSNRHNAYGLLRAPWNQNRIPYVTRHHLTYGFDLTDVPTCEDHYDLIQYDEYMDFVLNSLYSPHGTIHIALGGVWNADWSTYLSNVGYDMDLAPDWGILGFAKQKNLYRRGVLSCPTYCTSDTPVAECSCSCSSYDSLSIHEEQVEHILGTVFTDESEYYDGFEIEILTLLCNADPSLAPIIGDQLESASPNDPLFWPIHPTMDRLFQWRFIQGFSSLEWDDDSSWSVKGFDIGYCHGHNLDDILSYSNLFDNDNKQYSNAELLTYFSPLTDVTPYVYDRFSWPHCVASGYSDDLLTATTDSS